ncbi:uncharacterized protein LOC144861667 [Branchiostoma floridae x Branchiostoma japonicum]
MTADVYFLILVSLPGVFTEYCSSNPCQSYETCEDEANGYICAWCPILSAPENGEISGGAQHDDVVTFTCNQGYRLMGESSLRCQATAKWSGTTPTCLAIESTDTNPTLVPSARDLTSRYNREYTNSPQKTGSSYPMSIKTYGSTGGTQCDPCIQTPVASVAPTTSATIDVTPSVTLGTPTVPQVSTSPASVSPPTVCSPICGVLASCVLTNGTARCVCNTGFKGDGFTCSDVDECSTSPCTGPNERCENRPGSFDCVCLPTYIRWGDDDNCTATSRHNIDVTYTDNFDYNPDQHDGNSNGFQAERQRHINEFDDLVDDWVDNVPDVDKVATSFNNFRSGSLIANNDVTLAGKPLSSAQVQEGLNSRITSDPNSNFKQVTAKPYDYCGDPNTQDACYSRDYCTNADTGGFTCRCPPTHKDDSPDGLPGRNCNSGADEASRQDFQQEVDIMRHVGYHPNIVNLIGVCIYQGQQYMALEMAGNGDLLRFLRNSRVQDVAASTYVNNQPKLGSTVSTLSPVQLLRIACDVAAGMDHLSSKQVSLPFVVVVKAE